MDRVVGCGPMNTWLTTRFRVDLTRPRVMGIVNVTPDSFSDGGLHGCTEDAIAHCERLCAQGADILDIGGESTRPGARPTNVDEERARVMPVLRQALRLGVAVSVDTRRVELMRDALEAGVDIINAVDALRAEGAEAAIAAHPRVGVCLMHMRGDPMSMQDAPHYEDVATEVARFLSDRAARLQSRGVQAERIVLDPGLGFGKTMAHNLELHRAIPKLRRLGFPLLIGWSRKATLGTITGRPVHERQAASVSAALAAALRGARVLRVHDVATTVDALKIWQALETDPIDSLFP
jgi:dihydropteroate synthase